MTKTVYVGNLPYSVSNEELESLFGEIGSVSFANVIRDRTTGRSKGFGFVEMNQDSDVKTAIEKFNGYDLNGRPLRVNAARPKPEPRAH